MDKAGKDHWERVYARRSQRYARQRDAHSAPGGHAPQRWRPARYAKRVIEKLMLAEIHRIGASSILEVGAGDSKWLPYLAESTGAQVSGLDYSENACEQARRRLAAHHVKGDIICADLFTADPRQIGQFDFVYSLGVVEHFGNLQEVLSKIFAFVKTGGVLFTEIPNYSSLYGVVAWVWQPENLAKHYLYSKRDLWRVYRALGVENVWVKYAGVFSTNIVPWQMYPRWPKLAERCAPRIKSVCRRIEQGLECVKTTRGIRPFAPYLVAAGQKSA